MRLHSVIRKLGVSNKEENSASQSPVPFSGNGVEYINAADVFPADTNSDKINFLKNTNGGHFRRSELNYRTLAERMNDGVLIVNSDATIRYANKRFCELMGASFDKIVNKVF